MKKWIAMILVVCVLLSATVAMATVSGATYEYSYQAYTVTNVNLREGPGIHYKRLTTVREKTAVKVIGELNGWFFVEYNGINGYMRKDLLSVGTEESYVGTYTISYQAYTTCRVNLREGPGTKYKRLKVLPCNTKVEVIGIAVDWLQVEYDGKIGYICAEYLTTTKNAPANIENLYFTSTNVRYRMGPGTQYKCLSIIRRNTEVKVIQKVGDWYWIEHNGTKGYVYASYLKKK